MSLILNGFWLPQKIRQEIITPETPWIIEYYDAGRPTLEPTPESVGARWPRLSHQQWKRLLDLLSRSRIPVGPDYFTRLQSALGKLSERFHNPQDQLAITALNAIPAYTGYAPEMIRFTLGSLDLMPVNTLEKISRLNLPSTVMSRFVSLQDYGKLEGRIRFFGTGIKSHIRKLFLGSSSNPFKMQPNFPSMILGYAAGNVIGTSHLISLLAQVSALAHPDEGLSGRKFPLILVKNSRQEPVFTPLLFSTIEEIDPSLVSSTCLMIWDYDDSELQGTIVSKSDLVIAAAADYTIAEIDRVIQNVQAPNKPIRFHRHGHKVSFTTIGSPYLQKTIAPSLPGEIQLIHLTTLLSAIDSIYWDQQGCLSSRIHFVEQGSTAIYTPKAYGDFLTDKIRLLSKFLPRGNLPLHNLHNRFDKYTALTASGSVHICSTYDDDFLVVVDERPWTPSIFKDAVNDCVERTVIIRPIDEIRLVPDRYLSWLPKDNLQTMSVAIDGPDTSSWSPQFSCFADALGERGVTGIRTIGRGPFPQLAYSWDGYLPLDLSMERQSGYFTTVEFENTYRQIIDTYQLYTSRSVF